MTLSAVFKTGNEMLAKYEGGYVYIVNNQIVKRFPNWGGTFSSWKAASDFWNNK